MVTFNSKLLVDQRINHSCILICLVKSLPVVPARGGAEVALKIYIRCEQNDPCSGCYPKSFQEHLAFVFSSVSMAATEERLIFSLKWALEPTVRWRIVP